MARLVPQISNVRTRQLVETKPATYVEAEPFAQRMLIVLTYLPSVTSIHAMERLNVFQEDLEIPAYQMLIVSISQDAETEPATFVELEKFVIQ